VVKTDKKNPFKGRQFTAEIILWAVRWYLQFPISYRDLERMLSDRGVQVDHTTLFRWIQAYAQELDRHRQLNVFTCPCRCLDPERATHFQ
jgi:transposase, IS6 family